MFSRKKIAAISGLLSGLAVTCAGVGVGQAYASEIHGSCTRDIQGNVTCPQQNTGYKSDDGRVAIHQSQDCMASKPVAVPASGLLNKGLTHIGPSVTCSNSAPAPNSVDPSSIGL
ncbi:hypothetical protein AB0I10_05525 [Streptomyces sp. NPDC050636]|uniref:hypothetical protein n=1 Tax=Streptomyces sp. NPDC050636 TaxID=3154510 RepID=UPI003449B024